MRLLGEVAVRASARRGRCPCVCSEESLFVRLLGEVAVRASARRGRCPCVCLERSLSVRLFGEVAVRVSAEVIGDVSVLASATGYMVVDWVGMNGASVSIFRMRLSKLGL